MSFCLSSAVDAIRAEGSPAAGTPAGTVVVRSSDLLVHGNGTATAGETAPSAGELAVFCRPVVTAPAAVRRDGTVLADAWLPDLVRLGELERHLGDGVIEAAVDAAVAAGRLKPRQRRRIMSYPLVIRLMIAMTLMPDGSYCEALRRLAGLLADIPFTREWHVPTGKVVTDWRLPVPPDLLEDLFWQAAGPLIGDDEPSAVLLAGMMVLAADGMLVSVADTAANRAFFGCTGTAAEEGEGAAPFPQLKIVALTGRAGRAALGAVTGQARAGEQTLLKRLVKRRPDLFAGRVTCFDRNFPGHELITAILDAGGHVVARVPVPGRGQPRERLAVRRARHQRHRDHQPDDQRIRHDPAPLPRCQPPFGDRRVHGRLDRPVAQMPLQLAQAHQVRQPPVGQHRPVPADHRRRGHRRTAEHRRLARRRRVARHRDRPAVNPQARSPHRHRPGRSPGNRELRRPACINDGRQIRTRKGLWETGVD